MYVLKADKQIDVLKMLIDGASVSSTSRNTGVHRDTCTRLLVRFGDACRKFLHREMRDLELDHLQIDEMHTFVRKKQKRVTGEEPDAAKIGTYWLFIALDEKSRLIPAWRMDRRDEETTLLFMLDLAERLKWPKPHESDAHDFKPGGYVPITRISTDGFPAYPYAIDSAFGAHADYAQIIKTFDKSGVTITKNLFGDIDPKKVGTSYVERTNLTTRTFMKRCNRRTIAFSKKIENLRAATAAHVAYYNYCWRIKTLKTTPANAAGIAPGRMTLTHLYYHLRDRWPELFLVEQTKGAA